MKTALVTGASSGIGKAISKRLIENGIQVFGIGRTFHEPLNHPLFHPVVLDVTQIGILTTFIKKLQKEQDVHYLINNAGVGYFAPHEELNPKKIHEMVTTNLEVPLVLTQLLLRNLKKNQGTIINISSITATKSNTYGCAYGATKAGLSNFSRSLFDETRKYGVKVVTIQPDMTRSSFYRNANFMEGSNEDTYLEPDEIAESVEFILNARPGLVTTELTIQPQKHQIQKK